MISSCRVCKPLLESLVTSDTMIQMHDAEQKTRQKQIIFFKHQSESKVYYSASISNFITLRWEGISSKYVPSIKIDTLYLLESRVATSFPFSFCYKGRIWSKHATFMVTGK